MSLHAIGAQVTVGTKSDRDLYADICMYENEWPPV